MVDIAGMKNDQLQSTRYCCCIMQLTFEKSVLSMVRGRHSLFRLTLKLWLWVVPTGEVLAVSCRRRVLPVRPKLGIKVIPGIILHTRYECTTAVLPYYMNTTAACRLPRVLIRKTDRICSIMRSCSIRARYLTGVVCTTMY